MRGVELLGSLGEFTAVHAATWCRAVDKVNQMRPEFLPRLVSMPSRMAIQEEVVLLRISDPTTTAIEAIACWDVDGLVGVIAMLHPVLTEIIVVLVNFILQGKKVCGLFWCVIDICVGRDVICKCLDGFSIVSHNIISDLGLLMHFDHFEHSGIVATNNKITAVEISIVGMNTTVIVRIDAISCLIIVLDIVVVFHIISMTRIDTVLHIMV